MTRGKMNRSKFINSKKRICILFWPDDSVAKVIGYNCSDDIIFSIKFTDKEGKDKELHMLEAELLKQGKYKLELAIEFWKTEIFIEAVKDGINILTSPQPRPEPFPWTTRDGSGGWGGGGTSDRVFGPSSFGDTSGTFADTHTWTISSDIADNFFGFHTPASGNDYTTTTYAANQTGRPEQLGREFRIEYEDLPE
jgi:hypothetical protein